MLQNSFSIRQFRLTKWSFFVHSRPTTRNAAYIHPSHHSILELWRIFPNGLGDFLVRLKVACSAAETS